MVYYSMLVVACFRLSQYLLVYYGVYVRLGYVLVCDAIVYRCASAGVKKHWPRTRAAGGKSTEKSPKKLSR